MHAVVVRVRVKDVEAGRKMLHERVVPMVSSQPGFTSGVWLAPDAQSEGLSIALFETEAQARSQQITAPPDGPVEVLSVEIREVFAQA